jgi:hypothetical protein
VLVAGIVLLFVWIVARALAVNVDRPALDPEERFGVTGRRVVAAMVGFGMGGMSAEFSPLGIPWPLAVALALLAGAAAAWYAGWVDRDDDTEAEPETA